MPNETYKPFALLSVVLLWTALVVLLRTWPGNKTMSYSKHAAATRAGAVYYFCTFAPTLVLLFLFVDKWFVPTFHLPTIFVTLTFIAVLGQFIALLIPSTGGKMTLWHDVSSYVMFILLVPLCIMIFLGPEISLLARAASLLTVVYMLGSWVLILMTSYFQKHYLILQTIYGASFHLVILLATYVRK